MRFAARGLLILVVASLSACDASDLAPEADSPARTYMRALDASDASAAAAIASTELADPANMAKLRIFSEPASDDLRFLSATVTSAAVASSASAPRRTTLFYERPRGDGWLSIRVTVDGSGDTARIVGVFLTPMAQSFADQNRFTLRGKPPAAYAMLVLAAAAAIVTLWALIASFRTPPLRRRWLWRVFILIGVCSVAYDWRADVISFAPLAVNLFGAGFTRTAIGPWVVQWSLPLGAILFLLRRKRLTRAAELPALPT